MPSTTLLFLIVVALVAINQLVLRVAMFRRSPWVFWSVQAVNLVVACYVLLFGLPGFEAYRWIGIVFGLLLLFRMVQNNLIRGRYLRNAQLEAREEEKRQKVRELAASLAAKREAEEAQSSSNESTVAPSSSDAGSSGMGPGSGSQADDRST